MTDIIIYTTPKKLLHKQGKLKNDPDHTPSGIYYWEFKNRDLTKKVEMDDKVYFATKGNIRGHFRICDIKFIGKSTVIDFDSESWIDVEPIPTTPFQGFKYFNGGDV